MSGDALILINYVKNKENYLNKQIFYEKNLIHSNINTSYTCTSKYYQQIVNFQNEGALFNRQRMSKIMGIINWI